MLAERSRGGQASQVDRGRQQLEILGHADQPPDAGAAATVAAAQQVRELALDLGSGGPVVGQPGGGTLADPGGGQLGLAGMDGDDPATDAAGAGLAQRADAARDAEPGAPPPRRAGRMATVTRAGQVTVRAWRSMRNWSLANRPPGAVGTWVLIIGVNPCWASQARWAPVP